MGANHPIILFDGVCNLCNASIQFIIARDKQKKYRFASLQSHFAQLNLTDEISNQKNRSTIILLDGDKCLSKSDAVLAITRNLSGLWPMLYIFVTIPKCIRNGVYDYIAKNRYSWFGKKDSCMIPTSELSNRFID